MPAPISIVIPTLNAESELPQTLASLIEGLDAGAIRELIVADGGSSDSTREIANTAGARIVDAPPGRGRQLRAGVGRASGQWLLLLHADTWLSPGWSEAAMAHVAQRSEVAGYFRLAFRASGGMPRFVAGWANWRARTLDLPYGDQGLLIARDLLNSVGGVPDIPLMEDVELARALRGHLTELDAVAATSAARYEAEGWLRRGGRNLLTLLRFQMGADPARLAESYRGRR